MKHYAMVHYRIRDFDQFKAEFEKVSPELPEFGFIHTWLHRSVDDPSEIVIVHECEDLALARRFYNSDEYRQCIRDAGVVGEPNITYMEGLESMPRAA